MRTSIIAFALAASAMTGFAHAAVSVDEGAGNPSAMQSEQTWPSRNVATKTRADVRGELVKAQRSGQLAELRKLYRGS